MSGEAAVALMLDPASRMVKKLVVPEGWRLEQIVAAAAKATGLPRGRDHGEPVARRVARAPGLRRGQPRGLPVPGDLRVRSRTSPPTRSSRRCSTRFDQAAADADLEAAAAGARAAPRSRSSPSPSILEGEGAPEDYDKVARVIYNRLDKGMPLQLDSTVNYALGTSRPQAHRRRSWRRTRRTTPTRTRACRPGRSTRPGDAALAGGAQPGGRDWLYFVTTDPNDEDDRVRDDVRRVPRAQEEVPGECRLSATAPPAPPCSGIPIAHSLSPVLHRAAYAALGLDWTYDRVDVHRRRAARRSSTSLDASWVGPVAHHAAQGRRAARCSTRSTRVAAATGAANTVVLGDGRRRGCNTDVDGHRRGAATSTARRRGAATAVVLGGGATARSAVAALAARGAHAVTAYVRRPEAGDDLRAHGAGRRRGARGAGPGRGRRRR